MGSIAQDIISLPFSIILLVLSILYVIKRNYKVFILILGLVWYFFYAYGLYVIQGQYTRLYIIYLAIFGLSIYSLIFGILSFKIDTIKKIKLPNIIKKSIIFYLGGTVLFLGPVWIIRILPDMAINIPSRTYGVQIFDLCVVFPAFIITCVLLLKNNPIGNVLAGIAVFKGLTLCLSWAFSELTAPVQNHPIMMDMALISSSLTLIGIIIFVPYIFKLSKQ